ncbi:hypothetical protein CPB83DRAFT_860430 [Crepidotus variabilis]|uniref:Uncharacterized protein n=1 Tax=Crepidotus variabilis TaxID=179855 RepID=A0A9P6JLI6_9AGAR|nr:hypothetical protein CPB83DRAFT_860430 [Crepidotus variabilis]
MVSGSVFADRFISERLTDYIFLGSTSARSDKMFRVAKLCFVLRECIQELEGYDRGLDIPSTPPLTSSTRTKSSQVQANNTAIPHPYFKQFKALNGKNVRLRYLDRLAPDNPEKAVFRAVAETEEQGNEPTSEVVVKFTPNYSEIAHKLLESKALAPRLWFCQQVEEDDMFFVVMDLVKGGSPANSTSLSSDADSGLEISQKLSRNFILEGLSLGI